MSFDAIFTQRAKQITGKEFILLWEQGHRVNENIHEVSKDNRLDVPLLYADADFGLTGTNGSLFYYAPVDYSVKPLVTKPSSWQIFRASISEFFLGRDTIEVDSAQNGMDAELPFYLLAKMHKGITIVSPWVAERILADFINVHSDHTDRDYFIWAENTYPNRDLAGHYAKVRQGLEKVVSDGGTMFLRHKDR